MKYDKLFSDDEIKSHRDRWLEIGLATGPTDWEKANRGIKLAYEAAGLNPPSTIIKLRSPFEGAIAATMIASNEVRNQVRDQFWNQVRDQVRNQVRDQVSDQVQNQVQNQVSNQVWNQVSNQLRVQLRNQVRDQVSNQVWLEACYGSHDATWLCYYSIFKDIIDVSKLEGLNLLAESTGWFWPFEGLVIMTERPSRLIKRDGKVVYIEYSDGEIVAPDLCAMEIIAYQ